MPTTTNDTQLDTDAHPGAGPPDSVRKRESCHFSSNPGLFTKFVATGRKSRRMRGKGRQGAQHIGQYVSKDMAFFDEAGARLTAPQ